MDNEKQNESFDIEDKIAEQVKPYIWKKVGKKMSKLNDNFIFAPRIIDGKIISIDLTPKQIPVKIPKGDN